MTDSGFIAAVAHHSSLFGGITAVVRPVPIPNTAVKHCMADGSGCIASARVGSRQSLKKAEIFRDFGFLLFTGLISAEIAAKFRECLCSLSLSN